MSREELAAQNKLIAEQLSSVAEANQFERNKAILEARPIFESTGGASRGDPRTGRSHKMHIRNSGADVKNVIVKILGSLPDNLTPALPSKPVSFWPKDPNPRITFSVTHIGETNECPPFKIRISYTDRLDHRDHQDFEIPSTGSLVPLNSSLED